MKSLSVFPILFVLASCGLFPTPIKTVDERWCEAISVWVEAGPRANDFGSKQSRSIVLFHPPRTEEDKDVIIFKSLGFITDCEENCIDEADQALIEYAFMMAHYWGPVSYFEVASGCPWSHQEIEIDLMGASMFEETTGDIQNSEIKLVWERPGGDWEKDQTTFTVTYPASD